MDNSTIQHGEKVDDNYVSRDYTKTQASIVHSCRFASLQPSCTADILTLHLCLRNALEVIICSLIALARAFDGCVGFFLDFRPSRKL